MSADSGRLLSGPVSADRRRVGPPEVAGIAALAALSVGLATRAVPTAGGSGLGFAAGAVAAVLAVVGLRSVPLRVTVAAVCLLGAATMARFGRLDAAAPSASPLLLAWVVATGAALVSAAAATRRAAPPLPTVGAPRRAGAPALAGGRARSGVFRAIVVVSGMCVIAALVLGPVAADRFTAGGVLGALPDFGQNTSNNSLAASDSLDMTNRPRLSDRVVLTVAADRSSFWRTDVFDRWDGSTWRRSSDAMQLLVDGEVTHDASDLAATGGRELTQVVTIEAGFANALPAAPTAVSVESASPLVQRADATLVAALNPLGEGASYRVVSRVADVDEAELAGIGDAAPEAVRRRAAQTPTATSRTKALADRLAVGTVGPYAKVKAVEAWLAANTRYSIDAPLAPRGVDVVDHFLFETKVGWCEQVASSMVVLLRLMGVPARLATGFVPGKWNPIARRYEVRESDAHAWTEVFFDGVGWIGFDPTADVPIAGQRPSMTGPLGWALDHLVALVAAIVTLVLVAGPVGRTVARGATWIRRRRRPRGDRWAARAGWELERLGSRVGLARAPAETTTRFAARVASTMAGADPETVSALASVGEAVDQDLYDAEPLDAAQRDRHDRVLAAASESLR